MKAMKKVLAFVLALAMVVTAVPVTNAAAKTANLSAGKTVNKSYYTGKTHTLKLTGVTKADVKSTTWKSSNAKVVKIVADSQTKVSAQFKCVKKGTATVTAKVTLKNGNTKTYKAQIKVKAPTLTVSPSEMSLTVGETKTITAKKTPAGAKLTYTSSDPGVASISGKKITAHSAGHATITVQLANGTKKITKKVDVTVENLQDGLTAQLMTPITADYPNTVMVNQDAVINVKCIKNGKPAAGEILVASEPVYVYKKTDAYCHYSISPRTVKTDENGIATFLISNLNYDVKPTTVDAIATMRYTVQTLSASASVTDEVSFAAIGFESVTNTNKDATKLVPGKNYAASNGDRAGVAETTNMRGKPDEYVASQQVSLEGGNEHAVTFDGGFPWIILPGVASDTSSASKGYQTVDYTSGKYGTYENKEKEFAVDEDPRKLTYATVNFEYVKISKYSRFIVEWFANEPAKVNYSPIGSKVIEGPHEQSDFGVQIPITNNIGKLYIKVRIESPGQVNTAMNDGFKISTVDYVYRTVTNATGEKKNPLKDATITWSQVATHYSEEKVIGTNTGKSDLPYVGYFNQKIADRLGNGWTSIGGVHLPAGGKMTVKVPVFPYTGMAVLTAYDANNRVVKRYVCPTVNDGKNVNVPQYDNDKIYYEDGYKNYVYEISEDELRDMVGTVTQEGTVVTVNATKSGRSTLEGKVTVNGELLKGLTDAEYTAYTSVQWSPIPVAGPAGDPNSTAFAALLGQSIEVVAQLVDANGNKVSKADQAIEFKYGNDVITKNTAKLSTATAVTRVDQTTDSQGQAKLVLKASELQEIYNITARDKNSQYNVKLIIASKTEGVDKADLYWIDADLLFRYWGTQWYGDTITTKDAPTQNTPDGKINPTTGETWEYGVLTEGTKLNGGVLKDKTISINGLGITMAKAAGGVGTVTPIAGATGKVNAASTKAGDMKIVCRIDANSVTNNVTLSGADVTYAGIGTTSIRKTLNLNVKWMTNGVTIESVLPTGTAGVTSGGAISKIVYVRVKDNNGNPLEGKKVTFKADDASTFTSVVTSGSALVASGTAATTLEATTNKMGIAKVMLNVTGVTMMRRTTVTASVEGAGADVFADQTFTWYTSTDPELDVDKTKDEITDKYLTTFDATTGTITLTFNNDIDVSSVCKGEFNIKYGADEKELILTDVTVINNEIKIKVSNAPTGSQVSGTDQVVVILNSYTDPETGVVYTLTTENGQQFSAPCTITIKVDESKGAPIVELS